MFQTVCPPIKLIKGVQDGLLATLFWRTLIKSPEADYGLPFQALHCYCQLLISLTSNCQSNCGGWATLPPLPERGGERHLPLSWVTCYLPGWLTLSEEPEQNSSCKGGWEWGVCTAGTFTCVHRQVPSPPLSLTLCWTWGMWCWVRKPRSHPPGSHSWMRWTD